MNKKNEIVDRLYRKKAPHSMSYPIYQDKEAGHPLYEEYLACLVKCEIPAHDYTFQEYLAEVEDAEEQLSD